MWKNNGGKFSIHEEKWAAKTKKHTEFWVGFKKLHFWRNWKRIKINLKIWKATREKTDYPQMNDILPEANFSSAIVNANGIIASEWWEKQLESYIQLTSI